MDPDECGRRAILRGIASTGLLTAVGTAAADEPPDPTDLSVISTSRTSIQVSWDHPWLGPEGDRFDVFLDGEKVGEESSGSWNTAVHDLDPGTTYEVGVEAVDPDGNSSERATLAAETAVLDGPAYPSVERRGAESVEISWAAAEVPQRDHWQVYVDDEPLTTVDGDLSSAMVGDLDPSTTYDVAVSAVAEDGTETEPNSITVTTAEEVVPPAPVDPSVSGTTASSATIEWTAPEAPEATPVRYVVSIGDVPEETVDAGTTAVTITGLDPATSYDLSVVAVDADGDESPPATVDVETTEEADGPPAVGGTVPKDPDGDDVYEDLNGNERVDSDDVVVYFQQYDDPAMADNPGYFDLNGNDRTDADDVVVLFESL